MSRIETVRAAMMQAMKDHDKERKEALSLLLSALKNKAIDKRADLTEDEENAVVLREIKQCQESIEQANGREDIIAENTLRMKVYQEFAPKMMSEDEVEAEVTAVLAELGLDAPTAKQTGLIMKTLMPRVKGKADGALTQDSIAYTVRCKAENAVNRFNRQLRRSSFVKTQVIPHESGECSVIMALDDETGNLMTLELMAPNQRQAVRLGKLFEKKAEIIYNMTMGELLDEEDEIDS